VFECLSVFFEVIFVEELYFVHKCVEFWGGDVYFIEEVLSIERFVVELVMWGEV